MYSKLKEKNIPRNRPTLFKKKTTMEIVENILYFYLWMKNSIFDI
jgi:hypothetical protein